MTLEDKVHDFRLYVLRRAKELGNTSAACAELGISRTLYYRWRKRFERYGADGLHPRRRRASWGRPPEIESHDERAILALALSWPTWGPNRIALQLSRTGCSLSPSTVYRALRRAGLRTRRERLAVLEHHSAQRAGLLTERTRRRLDAARRRRRHVQAQEPGDLVCLDSFYIGKLKGVGKVWQLTACDAASSLATARIVRAADAQETAHFLKDTLVPLYRRAGWRIKRVLTDQGSEYRASFDEACRKVGITHTRTQPRHAWTNGFVERLQGTILHEHWRVAFRRRYFTSRTQLQLSLDQFLRFYNDERPHQGYRTRGRTPSEIFWGVAR
jgi:transposase InsO family protein